MARYLGLIALVVIAAALGRVTAGSTTHAPAPVASALSCPQASRIASLRSVAVGDRDTDDDDDDRDPEDGDTPRFALAGIVVDADTRAPVPHARVQTSVSSVTEADAAGRFHFDELEPGRYSLVAQGDHLYGESAGTITLTDHPIDDVVVTVYPAYRTEIRVVDGSTGQPCIGGTVRVLEADLDAAIDLVETADHRYVAAGLAPMTYEVLAWCDGLVSPEESPILRVASADVALTIELEPAAAISGVVVDRHGDHVPGIQVAAWEADGEVLQCDFDQQQLSHSTTATDDGTFSLTTLPPGRYHVGIKRGGAVACVAMTAPSTSARLVFDDSASLRGTIRIGGTVPTRYDLELRTPNLALIDSGSYYRADEYWFPAIAPGQYSLRIQVGHTVRIVEADVAGDRVLNVDLPATATVIGTIRYPDGSLPARLTLSTVSPDDEDGDYTPVPLDEGRFELVDVPVGRWELYDLITQQKVMLDVPRAGLLHVDLLLPELTEDGKQARANYGY